MTQTAMSAPRTRGRDSSVAIQWITQVLKQRPGAHPSDFAASAGVSRKTVVNLLGESPRPSLNSATFTRIMDTTPEDVRLSRRRVVSGEPARRILEHLGAQGWTLREIADAAGLKTSTLNDKNLDQVYIETLSRLAHARRVLEGRLLRGMEGRFVLVPSTPMLRRVEALMAMGWSRSDIAERAGVSLGAIRTAKPRVHATTSRAVHAAFETMRFSTGTNAITQKRARQLGYAPWSAWPDGGMDDEDAVPEWRFVADDEWRKAIRERYKR